MANRQQLHKRLSNDQVKAILSKYCSEEISAKEAQQYLDVSRSRLYQLIETYEDDPDNFSTKYERTAATRHVDPAIEQNILKELKIEKEKIIDNPDVPTKHYNYSYIQQLLKTKYGQNVSVPTIIDRAKKHGYWKSKPPKKIHDREVITNYVGELIQHDSSHHVWAPDSGKKWYLITSLDDCSRDLLFADLFETETSWSHISAVQSVFLNNGSPLQYYADQHSIFRYIKERDKFRPHLHYTKFTDDIDTQFKQVLLDCKVKLIYALSPNAKGKIERPYGWLQDHLVRTCMREGVKDIETARKVLKQEVFEYRYKRVHSTTGEIPAIRFKNAIRNGRTLFRKFEIPKPYQSAKDVFCLRFSRVVDAYCKVSFSGLQLKVHGVLPRHTVELRLYPDLKSGLVEVRFWFNNCLTGTQKVKISDIPTVQF